MTSHRRFSARIFRAENSRDLTVPSGMSSSSATSLVSCPSMADNTTTSRSLSGSWSIAQPDVGRALAADGDVFRVGRLRLGRGRILARHPASVGAPAIDSQAPGHPREPGSEPIPIAELAEAAERAGEGVLRHLLGVGAVAQHAVGDAEGQPGRIADALLEFAIEAGVSAHEAVGPTANPLMHVFGHKTAPSRIRFSSTNYAGVLAKAEVSAAFRSHHDPVDLDRARGLIAEHDPHVVGPAVVDQRNRARRRPARRPASPPPRRGTGVRDWRR